jgi:2-keto-4-pentenoate hydratase/2-oxohepta-3-ene-1,7-dioic acid hydratase in catechol pathway
MRFGHAISPDGAPILFAEAHGRRITLGGTLDDLLLDEGRLARTREELDAQFAVGQGDAVAEDAPLAPPILRPGKIVAVGLNYHDHCREFGVEPPTSPVLFPKLNSALCGHGTEVRWNPAVTSEVDWEAELAVIMGRTVRDAGLEEARGAIFGYTVVNDVTARDIQRDEEQWLRAKGLDTFCPLGPVAVTADEVPDTQHLAVRSRVNGRVMQDSSTAEMVFGVDELIATLSRSFTLRPGDVLATGTPLGVGAFRTPPIFLSAGDVMEMEVEGIGVLRNTCVVEDGADGREEDA